MRLWDTATGTLQHTLDAQWISSMVFSPDSRLLATHSHYEVQLWDTATGGRQRTWSPRMTKIIEFSQDSSYLITDIGILDFQPGHESRDSNSNHRNPTIFIEQGQWINLNGKNVLWLPPDFRPNCSAVNGCLLALGLASGRVSFIRFRV